LVTKIPRFPSIKLTVALHFYYNNHIPKTTSNMAPPSQITIATSSLQRLVKEEASYHKELKHQEARLEKLLASKDEDENAEYQLKQEVSASL
jgi:hypothetical protein